MSRTARSVNLTLTYLIITTMILSGIQVMLPALGLDWHEGYEELSEQKNKEYISVSASDWNWYTISVTNHNANSNDATSFVLDENNVAQVSYFEKNSNEIYYGKSDSGAEWEYTLVDDTFPTMIGDRDGMVSIALGNNNFPHIAYVGDNFDLKYATVQADGSWTTETVVTNWVDTNQEDLGISLAVDSNNFAHISYYDSVDTSVKYVSEEEAWDPWDVFGSGGGKHTKIQLDSNDSPRIGFSSQNGLRLATFNPADPQNPTGNSADWDEEQIEQAQYFNDYFDFVIDSNDDNHFAWVSGPSALNNLMYWKTGASCSPHCHTILGGSVSFSTISIDVDSNDEPAIGIKETGTDELRLFYTTNQGSWGQSTIGDGADKPFGFDINLQFDTEDNPVAIVHNTNDLQLIGTDLDSDDYFDTWDACDNNYGESWRDRYGCLDQDYDGQSDLNDDFWQEITQWVDTDGDMLGDNWADGAINGTRSADWPGEWVENAWLADPSPLDWDQDGFEDSWLFSSIPPHDDCSYVYGYSTIDQIGCPDADQDGYSDSGDEFPGDPNEYQDTDGDGTGDNEDAFPYNADEWEDSDGDGTGDNNDDAPYDSAETSDSDGDGFGDSTDEFPFDPNEWEDSDSDGVGDNSDEFPYDDSETTDSDNDGVGDNSDAFPSDPSESYDTDGDGYGDNNDWFPYDSGEWEDSDNDGVGDNSDAFPNDWSESTDSDNDTYGDNWDSCPYTAGNTSGWNGNFGCPDTDGDGYADTEDDFPNDETQYFDFDGDGYGENISGNNPDSCPGQSGTSTLINDGAGEPVTGYGCPDNDEDGYANNIDDCASISGTSTVDSYGCPDDDDDGIGNSNDPYPYNATDNTEDWDGDGYIDNADNEDENVDDFPDDATQWSDIDGDGYGDNANGNNPDAFPTDHDEWEDTDGDGIGDNSDDCIYSAGNSTEFDIGCPDSDGDGYANSDDDFPTDATQWDDWDGDGYGENQSGTNPDSCPSQSGTSTLKVVGYMPDSGGPGGPGSGSGGSGGNPAPNPGTNMTWYGCPDEDSDAYEDNSDPCPYQYGNSWVDRYGCLDTDQDGISDLEDPYPNSATTDIEDWDGDGVIDHSSNNSENIDDFPNDNTQWSDTDNDGFGDNSTGNYPDAFPNDASEWFDADGDGIGDNSDDCVNSAGNSTHFEVGCPDEDGDGYADSFDAFPTDSTQWDDWDGDGYGDNFAGTNPDSCPNQVGSSTLRVSNGANQTWYGCTDSDSDSYEDNTDPCPYQYGNSWVDRFACLDTDLDGISDLNDPYPNSPTVNVEDWDNDGYLDNSDNESLNVDAFPTDNTQWSDIDEDGYGDNANGTNPDAFPSDSFEWSDADADGIGDNSDSCVNSAGNSTQFDIGCPDSDGDGYANSNDAFPTDATQWDDWDGDGYGENLSGNNPDSCPSQPGTSTLKVWNNANQTWYGCPDSDSDSYEDNTDPCPYQYGNSWVDRYGCLDTDLDGISDLNDPYSTSATNNTEDWDNDGYLDNSNNESLNVDAFPTDNTQWSDIDEDGYGDNANGNNPDAFPSDPFEAFDTDGDGYGDNSDDCVTSAGNSTQFDIGCPDSDGDGYADLNDDFPNDATQEHDFDDDGYGDNVNGNYPDSCPFEYGTSTLRITNGQEETWNGCIDSDSDSYEDATDPCPFQFGNSWVDMHGCPDQDQDGISDMNDPMVTTPTNNTEDWDGDGYIDHAENLTLNTDTFPDDNTQWADTDGDGYGDNANGNNPDLFINESSQWADYDNDGYGDNNQIGAFEPDSCPFEHGTSDANLYGCEDEDGDGWANIEDDFITESTQWSDYDNDGYGDNQNGRQADDCISQGGTSTLTVNLTSNTLEELFGCIDSDGDEIADTGDPCPFLFGNSVVDRFGCPDTDLDGISDLNDPYEFEATGNSQDWDGDGYIDHGNNSQNVDAFPEDNTQWSDEDGDGYGDNTTGNNPDHFPGDATQWADSDRDGFGDEETGVNADDCPFENGNSTNDRLGCIDTDGDGYSDESSGWRAHPYGYADSHPDDPTQWEDADGDGFGDNPEGNEYDAFPADFYEDADSDNDGIGDNSDWCPKDAGSSSEDGLIGCPDADEDGWADEIDSFEDDPTQWSDVDFDGHGDNLEGNNPDYFPFIPGQWIDEDGDGYGDNPTGPFADVFPGDPTQWTDYDGDNCGDNQDGNNPDRFPTDPTQCEDTDGDGYGDNPNGRDPDMFIEIYSQWLDSDEDGLGDNISEGASLADVCTDQETGNTKSCIYDRDNDGFDDIEDQFPDEPTQWVDADEDGKGDNSNGYNGDPSINDRDNDGYPDPVNEEMYSEYVYVDELNGETRTCLDLPFELWSIEDAFPDSPSEWSDWDKDCLGDNIDNDDDNDGSSDMEELVAGTSAFASGETPWGGVWVPGANVELGAWDLIGILIGVPSVLYLGFAFVTRDRRARRYEDELMDCEDVVILEEISESYERALMLRLLGPHHGLMLERVRSRIEVQIETRGGGIRAADIVAEAVEHKSKKKLNPKDMELSDDGDWKWDGDEWVPASEEKDDSSED